MENFAEATCILKVEIDCNACKMRIVEVLGSICGEYSFEIDSEKGEVKIFALVDPNLLVKALARTGYHAKLKLARIQNLKVNRDYYGGNNIINSSYGGGYNRGGVGRPISYYPNHGGGAIGYYPHPQQQHGYLPNRPLPHPHSPYPYPPPHAYPFSQGGPDPNHYAPYGLAPGASPFGASQFGGFVRY